MSDFPELPSLDDDGIFEYPSENEFEDIMPQGVNSPSYGKNSAAEQGTEIPAGWKPTIAKPVPVVRCHRIKKDGERCKRWSIRGHTHCAFHSGNLPNVRKKADAIVESSRMRLMNLTDPAVDVFEDLIQPGTPDAIRLKAAENILNRAGLKDGADIKVEVTHTIPPSEIIKERLKGIRERLEDMGEQTSDEDVLDEPDPEETQE